MDLARDEGFPPGMDLLLLTLDTLRYDVAALEQQIDHMAGTKLNPAHGLKA